MNSMNIVLTLTFSIVMLFFMIYPAMKIVEWIEKKIDTSPKIHNLLLLAVTISLALMVGLFLKYV